MYADFFGFRELPFNNTPDPRFFYSTPDHEEALASLVYAVKERKGFVLLTGEVGAGKTLVTRMMLRRIGTQLAFANINHSVQSPNELMESICTEFELQFESGSSPTHLVRVLHDFLLAQFAQNTPVVLVLDEAQNLSVDGFEQLRMIGNLEADDAKLLQVAIVGQPELQRTFLLPKMRQLRQRIFRSFHLSALSRDVTRKYVEHRLSVVTDTDTDLFDAGATDAIYDASSGLPRVINTICDNALLSAYSADRRKIDGPFVKSMISQMLIVGTAHADAQPEPTSVPAPSAYGARRVLAAMSPVTDGPARGTGGATNGGRSSLVDQRRQDDAVRAQVMRIARSEWAALQHDVQAGTGDFDVRLGRLERRLSASVCDLPEARAVQDRLEPLVQRASSIIVRAEAGARSLAQRDAQLRRLAGGVKDVVRGLSRLLDSVRETTAESNQAQRDARAATDRLVAQSERSRQLANELTRIMNRMKSRETMIRAPAQTTRPRTLPPTDRGTAERKVAPKPWRLRPRSPASQPQTDQVQRMLDGARESLSDLRNLAQANRTEPRVLACADSQVPNVLSMGASRGSRASTHNEPASSLTQQVEKLLEMIGPAAGVTAKSSAAVSRLSTVPTVSAG